MLIAKKIHSTAVLNILQQLTEKFVKKVCVSKGMPDHIVNKSGGKIFTFGSFRLGVYGPGQLLSPNHPCWESPLRRLQLLYSSLAIFIDVTFAAL